MRLSGEMVALLVVGSLFVLYFPSGTSASTQIDVSGKVVFWNNTSDVDSATVEISIMERGTVLNETTTTTNSTGHFTETLHAGLSPGNQYTINITSTKGDSDSYLHQRFRHD